MMTSVWFVVLARAFRKNGKGSGWSCDQITLTLPSPVKGEEVNQDVPCH